ncbi:MAG TPA: ATP synthase F1 subunit delta [Nannocystis sp.]
MIPGSLARRYARALLQLADTPIQREIFGRDLGNFVRNATAAVGESGSLLDILASGAYLVSERRAVLQKVLERMALDGTVTKFLVFVFDRGRIGGVPQIARHYAELADAMAGRVHAKVTSARPLPADAVAKIKAALERATGKTILLESAVDPELIGGVVTQVGSVVYDGSLRSQLDNLRTALRS